MKKTQSLQRARTVFGYGSVGADRHSQDSPSRPRNSLTSAFATRVVRMRGPVRFLVSDRTTGAWVDAASHGAHCDAAFHRADTDAQIAAHTLGVDHLEVPCAVYRRRDRLVRGVFGRVIPGADSHSRAYGAYGAVGFGVGSTTLGFGWSTGYVYFTLARARRVIFCRKTTSMGQR